MLSLLSQDDRHARLIASLHAVNRWTRAFRSVRCYPQLAHLPPLARSRARRLPLRRLDVSVSSDGSASIRRLRPCPKSDQKHLLVHDEEDELLIEQVTGGGGRGGGESVQAQELWELLS